MPDIQDLPVVKQVQESVAAPSTFPGPLFYWEALRGARKANQYLPRLVLPTGLLTMVALYFWGTDITQKTASYFGEAAFHWYTTLQYIAIALFTPVHVAGTIVEERQRGTLMLLMITHLSPREIVRGKMLGSMTPIFATMLAGIPVLALLQLFGGISFFKVCWHSINALLAMLAVGMYSIRSSTQYWSGGAAVFFTYFKIIGGIFAASMTGGMIVAIAMQGLRLYGSDYLVETYLTVIVLLNILWAWAFSYYGAIHSFSADQRIALLYKAQTEERDLSRIEGTLKKVIVEKRIEGVPAEIEQPIVSEMKPDHRPWPVPSVYARLAVVWKQAFFPDRSALVALTWIFGVAVGLILFTAAVSRFEPNRRQSPVEVYFVLRSSLLVLFLVVVFRATSVLAEERLQKTLLSLLTLPITHMNLVLQISLGCLWRYRWLGFVCLLPLIDAMLFDSPAYLLLVVTAASQLFLLVMLSIFMSLLMQTALRARMVMFSFMLALSLYGAAWRYTLSFANGLVIAPFQEFPIPFIGQFEATQTLVALFVYWVVLWVLSYLLLLGTVRLLKQYAARSG
jgi:ABC-type transport system involved in multi-copper enzyme maturation permease subunit